MKKDVATRSILKYFDFMGKSMLGGGFNVYCIHDWLMKMKPKVISIVIDGLLDGPTLMCLDCGFRHKLQSKTCSNS